MKSLRNFIIILILLGIVSAYYGPKIWKSKFATPRKMFTEQKARLESQISGGENQIAQMRNVIANNMSLYRRSFPINPMNARINYQVWLTQLAEFCGFKNLRVDVGNSRNEGGVMIHSFRLRGDCSTEQFYRFLYEFYWTGYLHRIHTVNLQAREDSELIDATLLIEGLTMAKVDPNQPFPLADELPDSRNYWRRLASGPWSAYQPTTRVSLFQYSHPGIDDADFAILTAVPTAVTPDGNSITQTRWRVESTGKTVVVNVGERFTIGSFTGVVREVIDDMVVLRQSNGFQWILSLGDRLSDAASLPPEY